ncbi:MAG: BamA/TamA family outer membrane protein [Pirellulales bacterium]
MEPATRDLTIIPQVAEAQTGRFMLGVGVNSNAGVLGSIVLDEQNADLLRLPTSWRKSIEGRAFRGAGQQVRIEAVPGSQVSRYSFLFRQPYLFDTRVSFSASAYYFQRYYRDWLEDRLGGRIGVGYQFPYVPDLSVSTAVRMEQVGVEQPTIPTPPQLAAVLGDSSLFVWENQIVHDTRDSTFIATEGHRIALGFDMGFGTYTFPRGTIDARQHFLLGERPDGSGRQVLTLQSVVGFTGSDTPIFENYFAGGFSSMRGFNFRGVGPVVQNVNVGGQFQWLNTVEYMFSVTADDMIRGVVFCDFGTVEEKIEMQSRQLPRCPRLRLADHRAGPWSGADRTRLRGAGRTCHWRQYSELRVLFRLGTLIAACINVRGRSSSVRNRRSSCREHFGHLPDEPRTNRTDRRASANRNDAKLPVGFAQNGSHDLRCAREPNHRPCRDRPAARSGRRLHSDAPPVDTDRRRRASFVKARDTWLLPSWRRRAKL